jgi:hypothetical protein
MYLPPSPGEARIADLAAVLLPEAEGLDEYFVARLRKLAASAPYPVAAPRSAGRRPLVLGCRATFFVFAFKRRLL